MGATTLDEINSKRSCPCCEQKKLVTNDSEAIDEVVHYHCYSCGFEFSENDAQREYRDGLTSSDDESPWDSGFLVLIAMLVTILTLHLQRLPSDQPAQYSGQFLEVEVPVLEH